MNTVRYPKVPRYLSLCSKWTISVYCTYSWFSSATSSHCRDLPFAGKSHSLYFLVHPFPWYWTHGTWILAWGIHICWGRETLFVPLSYHAEQSENINLHFFQASDGLKLFSVFSMTLLMILYDFSYEKIDQLEVSETVLYIFLFKWEKLTGLMYYKYYILL